MFNDRFMGYGAGMGLSTVAPASTARRNLSALRPLLLLGGFVLVWLLLMTGAAQADEGPLGSGQDLGVTTKALTGQAPVADSAKPAAPEAPVREVLKSVEPVATPVLKPVTTTMRTAVRDVAKAVENTPVKPVVQTATDTVRKTRAQLQPLTNDVRAEVRDLVVRTTADLSDDLSGVPALDLPSAVADTHVAPPVSVVVPAARTAGSEHRSFSVTSASSLVPATLTELAAATDSASDQSTLGTPPNVPSGLGALTQLGAIGAGSAGSGAAPTAGVSLLDASAHLSVPDSIWVRSTDSDRRPAGPTYPPSSSPD